MKIQLINGEFTSAETIDLMTQMIRVKIQFLEKKNRKFASRGRHKK